MMFKRSIYHKILTILAQDGYHTCSKHAAWHTILLSIKSPGDFYVAQDSILKSYARDKIYVRVLIKFKLM